MALAPHKLQGYLKFLKVHIDKQEKSWVVFVQETLPFVFLFAFLITMKRRCTKYFSTI